ncbi:hypothetical protein [Halalkalibacter nanhaiisediminis]|uniref:Uncharacterized protein n=1 Tax=Halalkalibacter nanhaiisediminis TaxID=688079 RepID=A0A562QR04_9BACI|nr:hypothetical protein [Halalkalibacter nanhaiisediminis]TWI59188.1 hypothetical protein IQ10_00901 [Halalkalibacter nanhaiisediminis]
MDTTINKHLFFSVIYLIAALASGISAYFNETAFRFIFTILCGVFLVLAILSFIKNRMNKPKQI